MQVLTNWQSYACDRAVKRQADDIKLSLFNERIGLPIPLASFYVKKKLDQVPNHFHIVYVVHYVKTYADFSLCETCFL